jgi:iron complex outermembrane recepter protein
MRKYLYTLAYLLIAFGLQAQTGLIEGQIQDGDKKAVAFANVALYNAVDTALLKVEATNEAGLFQFRNVADGKYFLVASFIGSGEVRQNDIQLSTGQQMNLGVLILSTGDVQVATTTITATRVMVEVKPDRTVFNVDGTINSTGDDALNLMRKAPGVTVDNNDNINVLGRSGVLIYIDGKRLPLGGQELSDYLKNLPANQIDRIDIISSPGAKYDAEGNAGIVDIRLKRDKSHGANGSVTANLTQGQYTRGNVSMTGNFRNKRMNAFATLGASDGESYNTVDFKNYQNNLFLDETNYMTRNWQGGNYTLGADFFIDKKSTIGVLASGRRFTSGNSGANQIAIYNINDAVADSVLISDSETNTLSTNSSFNINYRFDDRETERSLNIDLDYGTFNTDTERFLPNQYYNNINRDVLITEVNNFFEQPSKIDIYTAKLDFESKLLGGKLGLGAKYSQVVSDNTFLVYDGKSATAPLDSSLSNLFNYDETVYAGYATYNRQFEKGFGVSVGLRTELTDAVGALQAFLPSLQEPPVEQNYWRFFPNVGLTWDIKPKHSLATSYGRRINRPDYSVLNPFNNRLSEISYEKGNPKLQPEIVNNIELGYTYAYRFNFKLAYSKTLDQITRLIGPDGSDPRANFISWENLAEQTIYSFNASLPFQVTKKWSLYTNLSASHINNQADYGNGAIVDVQAWTYSVFMQNSIELPNKFKGEISGWYGGPGVWGGVFLYESSWSLNFGLQRKFLQDKLNVKLNVNDVFFQSGWDGVSDFNGLRGEGSGRYDSRFVSVSVGYNFGNQNVKSNKRKTGLESEAGRVGGDN